MSYEELSSLFYKLVILPTAMSSNNYIPALRFKWLTGIYNPVIAFTMPEVRFKKELIRQANIDQNHSVLDFGAGTATLTLLIKKQHKNASVTGVDVDEKIIQIGRKKVKEQNESILLTLYDGLKLPYNSNSFDRVLTGLVFHHLSKQQKENSLREIYRVLKPGGELHIADWGKADHIGMRLAFYAVQLLDGFETTKDNVNGLMPVYMKQSGLADVKEVKCCNTMFGTLWLYSGTKETISK